MRRIQVGDVLGMRELVTLRSERVQIPHPTDLVHLQFAIRSRDAPSVTCTARSIARRHHELVAAGIREVAVFHSSVAGMQPRLRGAAFRRHRGPQETMLCRVRGRVKALRSADLAHAWGAAILGVIIGRSSKPKGEKGLGLPADFLIAPDGRVLACKYGVHTTDQWSMDDLLSLANR
jgi:hypothetical protein